MTRSRTAAVSVAALGALVLGALTGACSSDETGEGSTSTTRSTVTSMVTTSAPTAGTASSAVPADGNAELVVVLRRAVEEERGAEATYRNVIAALGEILPFTNIADSEARHVAALEQLTTKYGVDVTDIAPPGRRHPRRSPRHVRSESPRSEPTSRSTTSCCPRSRRTPTSPRCSRTSGRPVRTSTCPPSNAAPEGSRPTDAGAWALTPLPRGTRTAAVADPFGLGWWLAEPRSTWATGLRPSINVRP